MFCRKKIGWFFFHKNRQNKLLWIMENSSELNFKPNLNPNSMYAFMYTYI